MSENLDLVRSILDRWERGDFSSAAWADPEITFESKGFDAWTSSGVTAMARRFREFMGTWDEYSVQPDEFQELDGRRVLVLMRHGGRGKGSGVAIDDMKPGANLFDIRDGKVARLCLYWDRDRALADLGLEQ